ncbi:MAG TPA: cytochrome C biogenesis protein [Spirochaeta sp.]|nr:cytochrome C biogenesis protein [Spirochaeta sp.]
MIMTSAALMLQFLSAAVQVVFIFKSSRKDLFSHFLLLASGLLLLANLIIRSIQINFVAVTNTFESLVFFSAAIMFVLFFMRLRLKDKVYQLLIFGVTVISIALLAIASSPIAPKEVLEPIPALQSNWLVLHVTFAFIGESFFAVSFVAAIMTLRAKDDERKKLSDKITYTSIAIGYPIFSAGALVFGAIWAYYAWGRFWGWDPKETWALITWLTYSVYLHLRFIKKMRGAVVSWAAIIGFLFTLFTFFGVNFLLSGLHSY